MKCMCKVCVGGVKCVSEVCGRSVWVEWVHEVCGWSVRVECVGGVYV